MFKQKKRDIVYDSIEIKPPPEYRFSTGSRFKMSLYANNGYEVVSVIGGTVNDQQNAGRNLEYVVKANGYVKLPMIDSANIDSMNLPQAEKYLEEIYGKYFNDPFVRLDITNKRVMVFVGDQDAKVIQLENDYTSLVEMIALAGGIPSDVKAHRVKLIRGDLNDPQIIHVDLSTIEGMKRGNLIVEPNDIIYIEPMPRYSAVFLREATPFIGIITNFLLIYGLVSGRFNTQ